MNLVIIQDTREQYAPEWSADVTVERAMLSYADYSTPGLTDKLALELKWSLDDLACCVGRDRDRFDTFLRGMMQYPIRALIVAGSPADVGAKLYTSQVRPSAIIASTWAWAQDYGVPTVWAKDKAGATYAIEWWARRAIEKHRRVAEVSAGATT